MNPFQNPSLKFFLERRINIYLLIRILFCMVLLFLVNLTSYSQGVGINNSGNPADTSAMLDVSSSTKGILIPRMTQTQRLAVSVPASGLLVYQTDSASGFYYNAGTSGSPNWVQVTSGAIAAGGDLTGTFPILTIANSSVTSSKIAIGTIQRSNVQPTFKAPYSDTADYARASAGNINGNGTPNFLAKFTNPTTLGNSVINESLGKVGIGTTNPGYPLDVTGTANISSTIQVPTINPAPGQGAGLIIKANDNTSGNTAGGSISITAGTQSQNGTYPAGTVTINGGASDFFGNAIGASVQVQGFQGTSTNFGNVLLGGGSGTANLPGGSVILNTGSGGAGKGSILFEINGTEYARVNNTGNVGIGTSSPSQALEVNGTVKATAYQGNGSQLTNLPTSQWTTTGNNIYYNTGNIGIGTTTPGYSLDVTGSINTDSVYRIGGNTVVANRGNNIFVGGYAGFTNTAGTENSFFGYQAGTSNTGSENTFVGNLAGAAGSGGGNTAVGYWAGRSCTGGGNTFLGASSGFGTSGNANSFIGAGAGEHNTTGTSNTAVGTQAGYSNTTGSNNTFLGMNAQGGVATISNATAIGYTATVNVSNTMVFGGFDVSAWGFGVDAAAGHALEVGIPGHSPANGNGAYLTTGGVWTNASDKNKKENFIPINAEELLKKIEELPITMWNYKGERKSIKHIGPMAQDFNRIFDVGNDDKSISTIDPAGVALAAIKALAKRTHDIEQMKTTISKLLEDNARLKSVNDEMHKAQTATTAKISRIEKILQIIIPAFNEDTKVSLNRLK
jgi:hypothetical protein